MAKAVSKKKPDLLHSREGYLLVILFSVLGSYLIASRALDTGSLVEYFVAIVLFGLAVNRSVKIFSR